MSDRARVRAVLEMEDLILQAIGNLTGEPRIEHAKDLLKHALSKVFPAIHDVKAHGTFECPHCGRSSPHQHVIDRKGNVLDGKRT